MSFWLNFFGFGFFLVLLFMICLDLIMGGELSFLYPILILPLASAVLGVHLHRTAPKAQILSFNEDGLRLDQGELWGWGQFTLRIELRTFSGLFKSVQTIRLADAVDAVFYLHLPGQAATRFLCTPQAWMSKIYDPGVRFRVQLGKLLAYLPAETTAPLFPSAYWRKGCVFYPIQGEPGSFFFAFKLGVLITFFSLLDIWVFSQSPSFTSLMFFICGIALLVFGLKKICCQLDRVVVSPSGIRSYRRGLIKWEDIASVEQRSVEIMNWQAVKNPHTGHYPEGIAKDSYVGAALPSVDIYYHRNNEYAWDNKETRTVYSWSGWSNATRSAANFSLFCNAVMTRQIENHLGTPK